MTMLHSYYSQSNDLFPIVGNHRTFHVDTTKQNARTCGSYHMNICIFSWSPSSSKDAFFLKLNEINSKCRAWTSPVSIWTQLLLEHANSCQGPRQVCSLTHELKLITHNLYSLFLKQHLVVACAMHISNSIFHMYIQRGDTATPCLKN